MNEKVNLRRLYYKDTRYFTAYVHRNESSLKLRSDSGVPQLRVVVLHEIVASAPPDDPQRTVDLLGALEEALVVIGLSVGGANWAVVPRTYTAASIERVGCIRGTKCPENDTNCQNY